MSAPETQAGVAPAADPAKAAKPQRITDRETVLEVPAQQPMRNPIHARWFARRVDHVLRMEIEKIEDALIRRDNQFAGEAAQDLAALKRETVIAIEACVAAINDLESRTLRGRWRRLVQWVQRDPGPEALEALANHRGDTPA